MTIPYIHNNTRHKNGLIFIVTLLIITITPVNVFAADKVMAVVNGKNITEKMLKRYQKRRGIPRDMPADQQYKIMLEELINRELIYGDAIKNELDKKEDVIAEMEEMKKNLITSVMLNNIVDSMQYADEEIKAEYEKYAKKLTLHEYKARHILLDTEQGAKDVIQKLDKGEDFITLAKKHSIGPSNEKGGDLGWFKPDDMTKPFADAVIQLKNKSYTKTPIKTEFGWHVILREDQRDVPPPPYEDMKEQIKMRLKNAQVEDYIENLRKKAKIDRK